MWLITIISDPERSRSHGQRQSLGTQKGPAAGLPRRSRFTWRRSGDGFLLHVVGEQGDGVLAAELVVEAADELLRVGVHGLVADAFVLGRVVGRIRAMEQRVKLAEGGGIFEVLKDE